MLPHIAYIYFKADWLAQPF